MVTFTKTTSLDEQPPPPIHGDILEAILSHVPLIHLLPASHVSKSWNVAVSSAIRMSNNTNPWLILHTQRSVYPYPTTTHAYDPTSNTWIQILRPPVDYFSTLRSSQSNLLYMLSPSKMSLSFDPLHMTWYHAPAPAVWRIDPVIDVVGKLVVVVGGVCDFEEDLLAVEVYDLQSQKWTKSVPMPEFFSDSASSMWLSSAPNGRYLFIMEKRSGVTHLFDPSNNTWSGAYELRPNPRVFYSVIGSCNNKLILIGMLGEPDRVDSVKIWQVNCDSLKCEEIGEIPVFMIEKLRNQQPRISSIDASMAENVVYMYIPSLPEEVIMCEFINGGGCRWSNVENTAASGRSMVDELVFTCSTVGIEDLQRASRLENWRFVTKQ